MIKREILRLAVPAIISNITTPLLGLVDTAITGHLGAAVYIGAIAVGSTMFSMVYWLFGFLRMGTSGLTAQAFGASDFSLSDDILRRALQIALCASAAIILLSPWLADLLLMTMDADGETTEMARHYFMIVIWGAPAVLGSYGLSGWFLGMQDSRSPMWMAMVTNVVNIAVSVVLVYGFGLKIVGVATGTLVAQWAGLALGIVLLPKRLRLLRNPKHLRNPKGGGGVSLGRLFRVNSDIFLRTLCLVAVTVWFTRSGAALGTHILAANALLMQLFILFSYFMDGFAFAGEALAGKYFGANDRRGLVLTVRGVFLWGVAVVALFTVVYMLGGEWVLRLLTDDYGVVRTALAYLPWAIAVPVAGVTAFVWDGIFIGMTLTRQMLWTMIVATAVFFALYFLLSPSLGNHGLWLAFISYLFARGAVQTLIYVRVYKNRGFRD